MATRTYGQHCGLARALELVGERWALLIVRDLIPGAKRFTDLRRGLPRIPTNVLSARLKELERDGIVDRRVLPRPSGAVVYELTDYGRELERIVLPLVRWGAKSLGPPCADATVNPSAMVVGMRALFRADAVADLRARYELHLDDAVIHLDVDHGALEAGEGPLPEPDLTIDTDLALAEVLGGELEPAEAVASGAVRLTGDEGLFGPFVSAFRMPVPQLRPA
jgi:DNA-binding HxlR family transcriptional regulator/putative sterol carrier protein